MTNVQQLEILQSILRARVNILCLGDDFSVSMLKGAFPGISNVVGNCANLQANNKERLIMLLPTLSQKSQHIGTITIAERNMDVLYVQSHIFNSVSITICKDSVMDQLFAKTAEIRNTISIDKVLLFVSGVKNDIVTFIDDQENGNEKFIQNGIDTSIVCVYGRNNNAAGDQGKTIADTIKAAVDYYRAKGANAIKICTETEVNDNVISDWARVFSSGKANKVYGKIEEIKGKINQNRNRIELTFDDIKEVFNDSRSIDNEEIMDNVFNLKEIESYLPPNFRSDLRKQPTKQIKQFLLDNLKIS